MKKLVLVFGLLFLALGSKAQTASDLFRQNDIPVSWLGIDFSHVKLIGNFAEFFNAGEKSSQQIRDFYFPRWNMIILTEPEKYDIKGMLRKSEVYYDIEMIEEVNAQAPLEEMESYNTLKLTDDNVQDFINQYNLEGKEGIGVLFIAECLNKNAAEAWFHFVAINMKTKKVLLHERLRGEPEGFGLRNYWANSVYRIINDIKYFYFMDWKRKVKEIDQV